MAGSLKSRVVSLEKFRMSKTPIVVVVGRGETEESAFCRMRIDRDKLPPEQMVIIVNRQRLEK